MSGPISYSSHVIGASIDKLSIQLEGLKTVAQQARNTEKIHRDVNACIETLKGDLALLRACEAPLTEEQKATIEEHLQTLGNLARQVASIKGLGSWFKDRFSKERTTAKQDFQKVARTAQNMFHDIEWAVDHKEDLDDERLSPLLMATDDFFMDMLEQLAISGNERAEQDLIQLVRSGESRAITTYCKLLNGSHLERWVIDPLKELGKLHPEILENLAGSNAITNGNIFQIFLELTQEGDALAAHYLTNAVFSNPEKFIHLFPRYATRDYPAGRAIFVSLVVAKKANYVKVLNRISDIELKKSIKKRINLAQEWKTNINYRMARKSSLDRPFEDYSETLQCKILFSHIMRIENIVRTLTSSTPPSPGGASVSKCFAPTHVWVVGTPDRSLKRHDRYLPEAMAKIGGSHRIKVLAGTRGSQTIKGVSRCRTVPGYIWVQDNMTLATDRGTPILRTTAILGRDINETDLVLRRGSGGRDAGSISGTLGATQSRLEQMRAMEFADELGIPFSISPCFTEEGNSLVGRDEDGNPYVIVGQDSIEYTKLHLRNELRSLGLVKNADGRWIRDPDINIRGLNESEPSTEEVKKLLALNYGVKPEQVYICEQPGEYHLDVAMKIIGPKTVMINDSMAAAANMETYLRELNFLGIHDPLRSRLLIQFENQAQKLKRIEDKSAADLEAQGFTVIRFGGKTYNPLVENPEYAQVNLFNFVSATTPEPPPKKLIVAMGCPEKFQELFKRFIAAHVSDIEAKDIHFLEQDWSEDRLSLSGGVECMTKALTVSV